MATVVAKSRTVYARTGFGRFAAECSKAAAKTAEETARDGAKMSRKLAPIGHKRDTRPGHTPLKRSINWRMTGAARAEWYSTSAHALYVEFGTGPHPIIGKLVFEWRGGVFYWNNPRFLHWNWDPVNGAVVMHPGAGAQPFLRPAYEAVARRRMMAIAKKNFPG